MTAARPPLFVVFRPIVEADDEAAATDAADDGRIAAEDGGAHRADEGADDGEREGCTGENKQEG